MRSAEDFGLFCYHSGLTYNGEQEWGKSGGGGGGSGGGGGGSGGGGQRFYNIPRTPRAGKEIKRNM